MTADPREGLDSEGYILTGAAAANLREPYDVVLAEAVQALGDAVLGLYVYGSVATGQAQPPESDVDLYAVVTSEYARQRCMSVSKSLSTAHKDLVRDVGVSAVLDHELHADDDRGWAERCFVKHYCVNIAGADLRALFPRCRPTPALAREFIGDLDSALANFRTTRVAGRVSRRLMRSAAVLYSIVDGGWTTDGARGAAMITDHHPSVGADAALALTWARLPTDRVVDASEVGRVLDTVGGALSADVRRYLTSSL